MLLNRLLKPVTVIVLLALASSPFFAMSDCLGRRLEAKHCKPICPMTEMSGDASNSVAAAVPAPASCCKLSAPLPGNKQAAVTPQVQVTGQVPQVVSASPVNLPPKQIVPVNGAPPPIPTSSHLALLRVLLV